MFTDTVLHLEPLEGFFKAAVCFPAAGPSEVVLEESELTRCVDDVFKVSFKSTRRLKQSCVDS